MCGLLFTNDHSITKNKFCEALELMVHRGPDAALCIESSKNFHLGHNRLKILDLDNRSNQPFYSLDKKYSIIFNGEIYNFDELAKTHGIKQNTSCDTEVLVELFAKYGPSMLPLLNGMFSIVIANNETDEVFIARDRLGIKPLYIHKNNQDIIVSSEISPILELLDKTEFDPIGIRQYRKLRTFFNGHTLYKNIQMFPAGHYFYKGKFTRYWKLPTIPQPEPSDEELLNLIKDAVKIRCISDVPLGSYLSGGLDSTIIAFLANKPHSWTVGFENNNEFEWGRIASDALSSTHSEVIVTKEEFLGSLDHMIKKRREPLSVPNEVLLYLMTKKVKEKNTVVLSGEGADELFFGYDRIFRWAAHNNWDIKEFDKLYSYGSNDDIEIIEDAMSPYLHLKEAIKIVGAFFQVSHLHGLLRRLDNSTMLCSVEARVPFVDHRLVERMSGVSFAYRMLNREVKAPLKRLFSNVIPNSIINRKKIGFPVPLEYIFGNASSDQKPMDLWLKYNLTQLGIE